MANQTVADQMVAEARSGKRVAVVGAGPAGLMAAEMLASAGHLVTIYDAKPSAGRKFLMAGKSGLNITHSEPYESFTTRFAEAGDWLKPALDAFTPSDLIAWCNGLGVETFVGSSGRVFPIVMKGAPLLRVWLAQLRDLGVDFQFRHAFTGWSGDGRLIFSTPHGDRQVSAAATVLAMGGASWPRLGSDGAWAKLLPDAVAPFRPANCGFTVDWDPGFIARFAGEPVKPVRLGVGDTSVRGEFVVSERGIEGSAIYAVSAALRDAIERNPATPLLLDLAPDRSEDALRQALGRRSSKKSLSSFLQGSLGLSPVKLGLLKMLTSKDTMQDAVQLARLIKALPLHVTGTRPIAEAISVAGGIRRDALDENYMLMVRPGVFAAGEMLDWEAPTGGYLLTASMATGRAAGSGAVRWLSQPPSR
ncbi:NAD(P)/FAD-dependent oxidoreductase [Gimibacter soli]|uniref:TIGR03862 family flavoprotein n=1 Tax=Gimibacter soli TaxID=3024400 RepID=A0AAE9XRW2_9PROT|nr:TIGR03862 family flavoprotein [Gimibacter soli]WCL52835.1 TIGR03862 family flavoprotein [Gimibacter soli]